MMKFEHVFGTLVLKKDCLFFEPDLESNDHLLKDHSDAVRELK